MSKLPLWGPPDLGVESALGPRQPVLRVAGFPAGSPEAGLLIDAHAGELKNFYLGQSRNHALGIAEYTGKVIERGGVRYHYSNQSGQEIVTMEVHPKKVEQVLKPEPWDWAVIKIVVPLAGSATHAYFQARRKVPAPHESGILADGVVKDTVPPPDNADGLATPVTRYPEGLTVVTATRIDNKQLSTLYVDLRRFTGSPVAVDIFGYLSVATGPGPPDRYYVSPVVTGSRSGSGTGIARRYYAGPSWSPSVAGVQAMFPYQGTALWPAGGPGDIFSPYYRMFNYDSAGPSDLPKAPIPLAAAPDSDPLGLPTTPSLTAQWSHIKDVVHDPLTGLTTGFTAYSASFSYLGESVGVYVDYTYGYVETFYHSPVYVTYTTIPIPAVNTAEVRFLGGWGTLPIGEVRVTNSVTAFSEFQIAAGAQLRPIPTTLLRSDVLISGPSVAADPFVLLGTAVIDPKTHSVAFQRA